MIKKKPWGTTECLIESPMMQLHRITVVANAFCSEHKHAGRANVFYVVAGMLEIHWWEKGKRKSVVLCHGESHTILPGVRHQFRTRVPAAIALEMYYPVLNLGDIIRYSKGGRKK